MGTCFDGDWSNILTGIIPRALQDIFQKIRELEEQEVNVTCSFMELYCENLFDLLSCQERESSTCEIREDVKKGIFIKGLSEHKVADESEAARFLIQGGLNRATGATAMNDVSSRSHTIFTVNIEIVGQATKAKFCLVDLAGSERSKKTKSTGIRFTEGVKINEGLLALGNVISALGGGSLAGFVSYRDSKLTRLLQDSLGGNSLTLMIACVSPADYNIEETLSTLRYADRAKKIRNKPVKNQDPHQAEVQRLNEIIQKMKYALVEHKVVIACSSDCLKVKTELYDDNVALRQQLKCLSKALNDLKSEKLSNDTFCDEFIAKFQEFRDLVAKITSSICVPEQKTMVEALNQMIREREVLNKIKIDPATLADDKTDKQVLLEHNAKKLTAKKQIKKLKRAMKANQKFLDLQSLPDELILNYENTIKALENDIDELRSLVARRDINATIINIDRKEKISSLEKELNDLRKKYANLEKSKKLAENDKRRIEVLKIELQQMRMTKSQLVRQQLLESKRLKTWIASRENEIKKIMLLRKKLQQELDRNERQKAALKREVEKTKIVNKQLQETIDRSKKAQSLKTTRSDIQTFLDNELQLLMSAIDAKVVMKSLIIQREFLMEKLFNLRAFVMKTEEVNDEMKRIEEDLTICNVQISEARQKVVESVIDEKLKMIPVTFNSTDALRVALSFVMKMLLKLRKDFTSVQINAEDLQVASEINEENFVAMFEEMRFDKENYEQMKIERENDFVMKMMMLSGNDVEGESHVLPVNSTFTINDDSGKLEVTNHSRKRRSDGGIKQEVLCDAFEVQETLANNVEQVKTEVNTTDCILVTESHHSNESNSHQLCFEGDCQAETISKSF